MNRHKVLITGGDPGVGRVVTVAYAREGVDVVINHLPEEEDDVHEVVNLIKKAGRNVSAIPGGIRDGTFCGHLVKQAVKELGGLDILVNNVGCQQFRESIEELTAEDFDATFKTNVYAMSWIAEATIPHLSLDSVTVNTLSAQVYEPSEILLDYAQTKAAIVAFIKLLAKQLAPKGIHVNAIVPGPYWTVLQCCGGQPQEKVEKPGANVPLGRPG